MNPDRMNDRQADEDCGDRCKDAFDECARSGVTADPCHDLLARCKAFCDKDEAG